MSIRLGTSKQEITPFQPVYLAGFSHRKEPFTEIKSKLYVRVFCFLDETNKNPSLLITADLIWWGSDLVSKLEKKIIEQFSIPAESIIFHATHNHSGPQTSKLFTSYLGRYSDSYIAFLEKQLLSAIEAAKQNAEEVTVQRASSTADIGVNRRKAVNGKIIMAPNPDGLVDNEVILVRFETLQQKTKALLIHYACHPTTTGNNYVSSEFPGTVLEEVEKRIGNGCIAGYLQGCCGDIRPALIKGNAFYRGEEEDVERLGKRLASNVLNCFNENHWKEVATSKLQTSTKVLHLNFEHLPSREFYDPSAFPEDLLMKEWCTIMNERFSAFEAGVPLKLHLMTFGEELSFLSMNAEMVTQYGLKLKEKYGGRIIPLPYSNGMIGYVPTAGQLSEGGYEANDSIYYFALPSPFSSSIENSINNAIDKLIRKEKREEYDGLSIHVQGRSFKCKSI
ncbi:neutral/alkaline non-lysosomal ceramidase N-terminal domain-containing protein [Fictibacillus terranigra]|uniref:Neutral/alkaline non-lysosomal ceramidase N-terminal domain-containing protein n=1 Tax=Fictibacillus terranigra TaxID=3058424 RepID=A0ABT8E957_9BACL|nr:neutral/alkaline non-lysosomal ceramidase N-terminal domain-containing protein [Fictibacillus sp. CENA-BCM004]MDN4074420.1 neutral/alkaline non-lysosomal ceramidase N-terminal domain-containing protein [Fictibacillus sp. CENA-BCM004]